MRKLFRDELLKQMQKNKDIVLLLGGVGYGFFKPDDKQIINCEASEQAMVDIAVGLALSGKIPFVYSITPHLYRAWEGIRIYLDHEQILVKLVGIGRDKEYGNLGFTHHAEDAKRLFSCFKNIHQHWPNNEKEIKKAIECDKPDFISLSR